VNRKHLVLIGTLAVLVALGATYGVFRTIRRSIVATQPVVVANTQLEPGGTIQLQQLKTVSYPVTAVPKGSYANTAEVIGLAVLVPIEENEPILSRKLATKDAGSGLPVRIPAGMRAVSVRVNDVVSVTGFAKAGTHVDVLVTGNPNRDRDPSRIATTTILEQVEVLCAGKECLEKGDDKPADAQAVTLLVTPADAQKVMLAANEGRIQLSLRNPLDKDKQEPPVLLNAALYRIPEMKSARLGGKGQKQTITPPPPPPPPYVVELIRGDKRDKTQF
jgi:pilus assembly protein CpaB